MSKRKKRPKIVHPEMPADIARVASLEEARTWLRNRIDKGAKCPCCTQLAKIYRRKLSSSMAYVLMIMVREYRLNGGAWMHVPSMLNRKGLKPHVAASVRGDWAKLVYWGLIEEEPKPDDDTTRRTSGSWRPTGAGIAFCNNAQTVPRYAYVFDGRALRMSEELTDIKQALGDRFDYEELMLGGRERPQ